MNIQKSFLLDKSNFILYALVLFIVASFAYFYVKGQSNPVSEAVMHNKDIATLFVIYNKQQILVTSLYLYNPQTKRGALVDIPANTGYTFTNLKRVDRIDTVFNPKNPDPYLNAVRNLVGLDSVPFYIFLNEDQLSGLVDLMGGVEIFNVNNIIEQKENTSINLPAGSILLDGNTALQLLRVGIDDPLSQKATEHRQKFMQSLLRKLSHNYTLLTHRYVTHYLSTLLTTNIEKLALKAFWNELALIDSDGFILQKITGSTRKVDDQILLFPHYEGRLIKESIKQTLTTLKDSEKVLVDLWPSKIEIQNGTSRNGLASSTQRIYESMGFTVSKISNAQQEVNYTVVIDMTGNIEVAQKVADVIRATRIYSVPQIEEGNIENVADVQVILGKDFDGRYVQQISTDGG